MTADVGFIAAATYPSPSSYPSHSPQHRKPSVPSLYDRAVMASLSPNQSSQRGLGGGSSIQDKTPLSTLNLDFLRAMNEKRTTRDGQPQKRRGPKPDSKPALTRRQELNRQAQRTHRERKELYIKALEDEVLRLKEIFSNISQDKERLTEENRQLKALLAQNGLAGGSLAGGSSVLDDSMSNPSVGYSPGGSLAGSYNPASSNTSAFTPPPLSAGSGGRGGGVSPHSATYPQSHHHHQHSGQGSTTAGGQANLNPTIDYEQAGIDFVLTLEKPCMNHLPWMLERGATTGISEPCGHALMASCPPEPFSELSPDIPFGHHQHRHNHPNPTTTTGPSQTAAAAPPPPSAQAQARTGGTWTLTKADLATLLDLSGRLNLDGEITPVMAWGMVLAHPRLGELRAEDFGRLAEELGGKVRCYGFGAVMEEFEVRDALENVFSMRPDFGVGY